MNAFLVLLLTCCVAIVSGCQPPDCDRTDYGSCGNACCNMMYHFEDVTVEKLQADMQKIFDNNGPDGRYTLQPTADGKNGWDDLTPYNLSVSYIGQVWHTTKVKHYNDTIDMTIGPNEKHPTGSTLKIFSISQIGGAYGDAGQNYKNIAQVVKALGHPYTEVNVMGCPKDE